jgi:hypothetical protein
MRRVAIVLGVLFASVASAQSSDPLLAAHETDPLELARVVDRSGDEAILSRLTPETPIAVRAIAVVAATRMHAPETALPALVEIATGRDPDLAPRAMQSVLTIARSLDAASLDARESDRSELTVVQATFLALMTDESARPDLRLAARLAHAELADLDIPLP